MNTDFYRIMVNIKRENGYSVRELARICDVCPGTFIDFFNLNRPFRPLRDKTMGRINKNLGIPYEVMEDYNKKVLEERKK